MEGGVPLVGVKGACSAAVASVLIVDDEPDTRFLIRRRLEAHDGALSVVGEASSGSEAIKRWRELHPDVILLDHRMPGLSGLEVAEQILAEDSGQFIVLVTAHADDALARRAVDIGVRDCLSKTDLAHLRPTLLSLLAKRSLSEIVLDTPEVDLTEQPEPHTDV